MEARNEMSLDKQTLLNCPFCGGKPERATGLGEHWVACRHCKATDMHTSAGSAAEAWNTRPIPTTHTQEVTRSSEDLQSCKTQAEVLTWLQQPLSDDGLYENQKRCHYTRPLQEALAHVAKLEESHPATLEEDEAVKHFGVGAKRNPGYGD